MAENIDLMNTQTGGEGETIQLDTQEKITPEQFDVDIQAQDTPDEVIPTQPVTEPQTEVVGAQPSQTWSDQQSFEEEPPIPENLQEQAPTEEVDIEQPNIYDEAVVPFGYDDYVAKYTSPDDEIEDFSYDDAIKEDMKSSGMDRVINIYDENKERGTGIFGSLKNIFKKEPKPLDKIGDIDEKTSVRVDVDGDKVFIDVTPGGEIPSSELKKISDGSTSFFDVDINKEEKEEDLTSIVDKPAVLSKFESLTAEAKENEEAIKKERKNKGSEILADLKKRRDVLKNSLSELKKDPEYKQSVVKSKPPKGDNAYKGGKVYDYHPDNYLTSSPLSVNATNVIFEDRIKKGTSEMNANNILYKMFAKPSDGLYWSGGANAEEGYKTYVKNVVHHNDLSYEELVKMDKQLRAATDFARSNGGVHNGKRKAALLPYWGYLPKMTFTEADGIRDKNGNLRSFTVFSGIQENDKQKESNKNGYGQAPKSKESFQYQEYVFESKNNDPFYVPNSEINVLKKQVKGFSTEVWADQKRLARKKDANGDPYLKSNKGQFGVGITGVMDDATRQAKKREEDERRAGLGKFKKGRFIKGLEGGEAAKGADIGEEYSLEKDNPFLNGDKNATYGKYKITQIPTFTSTKEAVAWATNHLADNKKNISYLSSDVSLLDKNQDDFAGYINGLGLGVTVDKTGAWYKGDSDKVVINPPKGVTASPLEIDLGESGYELNKNQLKKMSNWLNAVQESPRDKFLKDWTAVNDAPNYLNSRINKATALGNEIYYSGATDQGKINVTGEEGRSKLNQYISAVGEEQAKLEKDTEIYSQKSKQYNANVQPAIDRYNKVKEESQKKLALIDSELNKFDALFSADKISEEEFNAKSKELSDRMNSIQSGVYDSYKQMEKAVGGNAEILGQIQNDANQLEDRTAQLITIKDNLDELAGIQIAKIKGDNTGPNTVGGSLVSALWSGFQQPTLTAISAASDILIQAGIYPEGMTKEEALKMNNDWKSDFLYGELSDSLMKGMGLYKSEGYTDAEGFVTKALTGVAESIGTQFNPLVQGMKGTPLAKVASFMGFAAMSYNGLEKEILSNPDLKDMPEWQRKTLTIPYAIGMGALEQWGYGKLLRGNKSSVTQQILTSTINAALKKAPKNASLESIEALIKGDLKNVLVKVGRGMHSAGMKEFEAEALQAGLLDIGLKELADNVFDLHDAFNSGQTMKDYMETIVSSGAAGYIGGAALGGVIKSVERFSTGKVDIINPTDYEFFRATANDENLKKLYTQSIANDFIANKITKDEAEQKVLDFENLAALDRKVSDAIDGEDRVKMVDLLRKKQVIQERMKELDESQQNLPNNELNRVNKDIQTIVASTEEKLKKQEENVTEDEQGVSGEVGEGQEPIETQPVVETSQEEVSPGGMVQEEQTEVIPTEEVETEPEKTTTETITGVLTTGQTQVESDLIGQDVSTGKQRTTSDIQTGETVSKFEEGRNPTKGKVVNVEADPRNKNVERLILEDGTVLNRNKNTGAITLNNQVKATAPETTATVTTTNEFDELAGINSMSPAKKVKAMKAFNEKHGDKAERITKIDSKFTSIVNKLVSNNIVKKKC
jgi:hypothetical protein